MYARMQQEIYLEIKTVTYFKEQTDTIRYQVDATSLKM